MNFFTHEGVVCLHCRAVYTLGRFTRRELGHFGRQAQLSELIQEQKMLLRVQTLFARYPRLQQLYAKDSIAWMFRTIKPIEEWLHAQIPESNQWNFTEDEREVLEYLSHRSFAMPGRLTKVDEDRQRLLKAVTENPVRCQQCGQDGLQLDAERLNLTYAYYLEGLAYNDEYPALSGGCWLFTVVVGLLGIWGLTSGFGIIRTVCTLLLAAAVGGISLLGIDWFTGRKPHKVGEQTDKETGIGAEGIFRGRYYSHWEVPHFEWNMGVGKPVRRCELFSAAESGWEWFTDALDGHRLLSRNVYAVFDLEFRGVFITTGHFGHRGLNPYLVEIEEMLSARLVSADYGDRASEELLRPAAEGPEAPEDELLRPSEPTDAL